MSRKLSSNQLIYGRCATSNFILFRLQIFGVWYDTANRVMHAIGQVIAKLLHAHEKKNKSSLIYNRLDGQAISNQIFIERVLCFAESQCDI